MERKQVLKTKSTPVQKADSEPLQAQSKAAGKAGMHLTDNRLNKVAQQKANTTGLPDNLKSGIENLSGHSMDDVKVHYNSSQPAQLNAHAYAQGTDIHIASGQEKHLPHEAWHVVQQKQGRVRPTKQLKSNVNINNDVSLEKEADVMGAKAVQGIKQRKETDLHSPGSYHQNSNNGVVQRVEVIPVNQAMSQSLIDPGAREAKEYGWNSSFWIYLYNAPDEKPHVQVVIRIATNASQDVFAAWNASIGTAWNYKFAIKSGAVQFPITVEIVQVPGGDVHKNYDVESVKQDSALGERGYFGTESMTKWGEGDPQDIPHEVGHMLGNKDEYGTVDGKNWSEEHSDLSPGQNSIMFKGNEPPRLRHFNLILSAVAGKLAHPELVKYMPGAAHGMAMMAPGMSSGRGGGAPSSSSSGRHSPGSPVLGAHSKSALGRGSGSVSTSVPGSSSGGGIPGAHAKADSRAIPGASSGLGFGGEMAQRMHQRRVEKIQEYVMANVHNINQEQSRYLASLNWAKSPEGSQTAMEWLNLS